MIYPGLHKGNADVEVFSKMQSLNTKRYALNESHAIGAYAEMPLKSPFASAMARALFLARFLSTFSMKASPALYELRTRGPLAQYIKPMSRARCLHSSNVSGVTYSSTFM